MYDTPDLERLRGYQAEFAATIAEVSPDAPVAGCGDWVVRDLVEHLGGIYTWAAYRAGGPRVRLEPGGDPAAGYVRAATVLTDVLGSLDPDQPCWTLLDDEVPDDVPRRGTRRFWHRRQANETLVHLWDLCTAGGLAFESGDADWLDCLDEVLTVLQPRQLRLGRVVPPAVGVRFVVDAGPVLDLPGDGGQVSVFGSAQELALFAWGRVAPDALHSDHPDALASALVGIVP